jgi:hypothetical protein
MRSGGIQKKKIIQVLAAPVQTITQSMATAAEAVEDKAA